MNFKQCLVIALPALLCGALLGYLAAPTTLPETEEETVAQSEKTPAPKAKRAASTDDAALNRLRNRIQELERQLADRDSTGKSDEAQVETSTNRPPERREGGDFRARMEEWRKTNPEQYAQMTNRFARMRSEHIERVQGRLDTLASVDTSRMNERQKHVHLMYQELLAQQTELRDAMRPGGGGEDMSEEQRRANWERLQKLDEQVNRLAGEERNTLLQQEAIRLGIKGSAAKEAVETIKAIYQATETEWRHGPGRGRGPGGRGGRR